MEAACLCAGRSSGDLVHALPYTPELHFAEFASVLADMKNSVAVNISCWLLTQVIVLFDEPLFISPVHALCTKLCSLWQIHMFVTTHIILSRQAYFCRNKNDTYSSSRQWSGPCKAEGICLYNENKPESEVCPCRHMAGPALGWGQTDAFASTVGTKLEWQYPLLSQSVWGPQMAWECACMHVCVDRMNLKCAPCWHIRKNSSFRTMPVYKHTHACMLESVPQITVM